MRGSGGKRPWLSSPGFQSPEKGKAPSTWLGSGPVEFEPRSLPCSVTELSKHTGIVPSYTGDSEKLRVVKESNPVSPTLPEGTLGVLGLGEAAKFEERHSPWRGIQRDPSL